MPLSDLATNYQWRSQTSQPRSTLTQLIIKRKIVLNGGRPWIQLCSHCGCATWWWRCENPALQASKVTSTANWGASTYPHIASAREIFRTSSLFQDFYKPNLFLYFSGLFKTLQKPWKPCILTVKSRVLRKSMFKKLQNHSRFWEKLKQKSWHSILTVIHSPQSDYLAKIVKAHQ